MSIRTFSHGVNFVEDTQKMNFDLIEMDFIRDKWDHENVHPPGNLWKSGTGHCRHPSNRIEASD